MNAIRTAAKHTLDMQKEYRRGQRDAINLVNILPLFVMRETFGFGKKRLERFTEGYALAIERYNKGELDLYDVVEQIEKDTGLDYSEFIRE